MNIFGVIPARSGSKGIKNKNIQKISGQTLLEISIKKFKLLQKKKLIRDFIVSTDSKLYADLAKDLGSKVQMRPKKLSTDKTRIVDVLSFIKKIISLFVTRFNYNIFNPSIRYDNYSILAMDINQRNNFKKN